MALFWTFTSIRRISITRNISLKWSRDRPKVVTTERWVSKTSLSSFETSSLYTDSNLHLLLSMIRNGDWHLLTIHVDPSSAHNNPATLLPRYRNAQFLYQYITSIEESLGDILEVGSILLLKISAAYMFSIDFVPSSKRTCYVALSHVWFGASVNLFSRCAAK